MLSDIGSEIKKMERQGYRFVGPNRHSAIKVCEWCRRSLGENGFCYKQKFYGISSHRCIQMTPNVFACTLNCSHCWRTMDYSKTKMKIRKWDRPKEIIDGCIKEQKEILQGFGGNPKTKKEKFYESLGPRHVAISLSGEPCLYPYLPELIDEINNRQMTSFLVTNGTIPEMLRKLIKHQPTQLYVTLPAPNKDVFEKTAQPLIKNAWEQLLESLRLLKNFKRTVIRLTLVKELNMVNAKEYAELIKEAKPTFVEAKGFMSVGGARSRMGIEFMPLHKEIKEFAKELEKYSGYKIKQEKEDSRVVLLGH